MKKPLFALAIIAFGIGIAMYTNASYKEGNETMGATMGGAANKATASKENKATTATAPATAPASDQTAAINSVMNNPDIKKMLSDPALQSLMGGMSGSSAPSTVQPNTVSPPM